MFLRNVGNNLLDQEVYCDMTSKRVNSGTRQTVVARQWLDKQVSLATDMHTTVEEILEAVFSMGTETDP